MEQIEAKHNHNVELSWITKSVLINSFRYNVTMDLVHANEE